MITQVNTIMQTPHYRLPWGFVGRFLLSFAACRSRSFANDSQAAVDGIDPSVRIWGVESIPPEGPCLVACNHYYRPGFNAWWLALAVSAAIATHRAPQADPEIHWVITAAWTFPDSRWKQRILTPLTRWAFKRTAEVYDFVPMPPMPPTPEETTARAAAVLRTLKLARRLGTAGGMIGLAPEGMDFPTGLGLPPPGAGEFIGLLVKSGLPVLPVGVGEAGGRLTISFGRLFKPEIPLARALRDHAVAGQVMEAIEMVLPGDEKPSSRIFPIPL